MYIKINNLIQDDGKADYKGLNLKKIQPGTQVYPKSDNVAYFIYSDKPIEHEDVEVITEEEYQKAVDNYNEYLNSVVTPEKELEMLKQQVVAQQAAINILLGV